MEEAVKVYFCDLCNESVPLKDVETGAAKTIKGKVVGACCVSLLAGAQRAAAAPVAARSAAGSGLVFLGGLLLVAIGGAAWWVDSRTQAELRRQEDLAKPIGSQLAVQGDTLKDLRARTLEAPSRKDLEQLATTTGDAVAPIQASVRALEAKIEAGAAAEQRSRDELRKTLESVAVRQSAADGVLASMGGELRKMAGDLQAVRQMPLSPGTFGGGPPAGTGGETAPASGAPASPGGEAGIPPALSHFVKQLTDPDAGTRWTAVEKLSGSGEKRVVSHLLPVLKDADPFVRRICAAGLGELGAREAAAGLIEALADGESIVRDAAYRSLRKLTGQNVVFDPEASADKRAEGVRRWNEWWKTNKESFLAGK